MTIPSSRSPFAPGSSPFHVRGSTYVGIREHVENRLPGGMEAWLERLPDEEHRRFASQIFLPVGQYDALPIRPLTEAIAAVEQRDYAESVRSRAAVVAKRDITGLYRLLLHVVSPDFVLERLQRALLRYFDFGRLDMGHSTKGRAEGVVGGLPAPLAPWFAPMIVGYATEVLRASGASSPHVSVSPSRPEGERAGVPLMALRTVFTWQ